MNRLAFIFSFIILSICYCLNTFAQDELDHLVLNTKKGPIVIQMDSVGTPNHFAAITKMVEMGIYNGTSFSYAEESYYAQLGDETFRNFGFFPEQKKLIKPIENEITDYQHFRGAVTMPSSFSNDLDSGKYIFTVMLDYAPELDKKQTIIGIVTHGLDILDEVAKGSQNDSLLDTPLKIDTAVFMTKTKAIEYYKDFKEEGFKSDIFDFSKYSFLAIVFIQLFLYYGRKKIDKQTVESIQLAVFLIAGFSAMAQFYPNVGDSTLASIVLVLAVLFCLKLMSSLERSRGLQS